MTQHRFIFLPTTTNEIIDRIILVITAVVVAAAVVVTDFLFFVFVVTAVVATGVVIERRRIEQTRHLPQTQFKLYNRFLLFVLCVPFPDCNNLWGLLIVLCYSLFNEPFDQEILDRLW